MSLITVCDICKKEIKFDTLPTITGFLKGRVRKRFNLFWLTCEDKHRIDICEPCFFSLRKLRSNDAVNSI